MRENLSRRFNSGETMDTNVCSRRVHDGYATIRARGRSRPRAVYRSDSEEFLKESGGPYSLLRVSAAVVPDLGHRIPRWSDLGKDQIFENYGTLRRTQRRSASVESEARIGEKMPSLNTFSGGTKISNLKRNDWTSTAKDKGYVLQNGAMESTQAKNDRIYDMVPVESIRGHGKQKLDEHQTPTHYGTLMRNARRSASVEDKARMGERVSSLNTFSGGKVPTPVRNELTSPKQHGVGNVFQNNVENQIQGICDRVYNMAPMENDRGHYMASQENYETLRREPRYSTEGELRISENIHSLNALQSEVKSHHIEATSIGNIKDSGYAVQNGVVDQRQGKCDRIYDMVPLENDRGHSEGRRGEECNGKVEVANLSQKEKRSNHSKDRQHIYAVPNTSTDPIGDSRSDRSSAGTIEGNYVPSGDLYRSAARYIEDINRNIAEIDKSYEELRSSKSRHSAYGVINKIAKGDLDLQDSNRNAYVFRRNRDMAPMPPISPNFGEQVEEKTCEVEAKTPPSALQQLTSRNVNSRPNSYGKLPPKILPRSSSIENTSRHSSGSTSSTRSTESLYAISETYLELPKNRNTPGRVQREHRRMLTGTNQISRKSKVEANRLDSSKEDLSSADEDSQKSRGSSDTARLIGTMRKNKIVESDFQARPTSTRKERSSSRRSDSFAYRKGDGPSPGGIKVDPIHERKCGTLPIRRPRAASRPLHKSSEDVLDGERLPNDIDLERSYSSTFEVSQNYADDFGINFAGPQKLRSDLSTLCLLDATDLILKGQMERSRSHESKHDLLWPQMFSDTPETGQDFPRQSCGRTRHNSLESEVEVHAWNPVSPGSGFATLPRRADNSNRDAHAGCEPPRRLSGTVPLLEPLYEHAVSDPVKPRSAEHVIPWWELATKKYRHRSCPSLQAHVVSAFEQSLSNMTQRLQQLTATAEKKDSELQELRDTIERLRKQSAEAGLNNGPANGRRHTLGDSEGTTGCTGNSNHHQGSSMARQLSADSVTSLNSLSSACSASSHHKKKGWLRSSFSKAFSRSRKNRHGSVSDAEDCKDGPGDLSAPNSPRLPTAVKHESAQGQGHGQQGSGSRTNGQKSPEHENNLSGSKSSSALYKKEDEDVDELKKQLREKDMVLTDIRLEALSSAHQLESLKDTVIKMRNEMLNLKQNNERLQRLVTSKSLTSSQSSLPSDPERRFSMTEVASSVAALSNGDNASTADQLEDLNVPEHPVVPPSTTTSSEPPLEQDTDGKRINVAIYLGGENTFNYNAPFNSNNEGGSEPAHCIIANVCISNKTSWDALDSTVRRCFKDYVSRVDPVTNLGLGVECVAAYYLGEASRCITDSQHPELLPCGYLVGHVKTIYLVLSGYSWLAVDTLIPRSIVQRLVSLLTEHRRVILCGPSGTGKSYLAGKLAHALVDTDSDIKDAAAVATFNVDHKSSKELRQYLAHIAERCDSNAADELPRVIILENLQHAASLGELFSGLLGTRHSSCPAIIGTMSQATCSTTNLQLHHNFRWVLCANHMEPVKGFLGRYLRRKLLEHELRESGGSRNAEMAAVVEWLPRVWLHLNKFLETHSSSDVTLGPRLFLPCPMEVAGSQVWFTDLWNYSVIPYLVEAVREGLTLYGRRVAGNGNSDAAWEDPAQFITSSYPWISTHAVHGGSDALLRLRPEDVGYDVVSSGHASGVGNSSVKSLGSTHSDNEGDPLLNMLMRLQEAANYSSPHSNDSDSVTSLDSSHTRHSEDLSSSTSSSKGVESAL